MATTLHIERRLSLRRARWLLATVLSSGLLAAVARHHGARAEPLPKEACDLLGEEHQRLVDGGVREWMAGGAATASTRLSGEQLKAIQRYIEVDEQLAFRCGLFKVRYVLPRDPEEPPEPEPAKAKEGKAREGKEGKKAPGKAKGKAQAEAKEGRRETPEETAAPAPAAKLPARPKPKIDDAYRPGK